MTRQTTLTLTLLIFNIWILIAHVLHFMGSIFHNSLYLVVSVPKLKSTIDMYSSLTNDYNKFIVSTKEFLFYFFFFKLGVDLLAKYNSSMRTLLHKSITHPMFYGNVAIKVAK